MRQAGIYITLIFVVLLSSCGPERIKETEENDCTVVGGYEDTLPHLPTRQIFQFYEYYGEYYAGTYMENGGFAINVKNTASEDAIAFLIDNHMRYHLVEYSYGDLNSLKMLLADYHEKYHLTGIAIDEKNNVVSIGVLEGYQDDPVFQHYIDIDMLVIDSVGGYTTVELKTTN